MMDISLWLLPKKEEEIALQRIIDDLASRHHAYPFLPHITVYYPGSVLTIETVMSVLKEAAVSVSPFTLSLEAVEYADIFTKTLFASYKDTEALQKIYTVFHTHFYKKAPYVMHPHMSLLYKNHMLIGEKEQEKSTLSLPSELSIDRIALITKPGSTIEKEADVLAWQVHTELFLKK